mmetsp:Transcript_6029/g.13445  ORF Transcript_6029/g.13445 Transcript_6029/m.13445 type:complete len:454 (+) Transcript_6029:889-2250(+)
MAPVAVIFALATLLVSNSGLQKRRQQTKLEQRKQRQQDDSEQGFGDQEPILPDRIPQNGPFPTYFTCRHTYEDTLMTEIETLVEDPDDIQVSSPLPGLVRVDGLQLDSERYLDPVYALQCLPDCRIVESSNSIKGLARSIASDTKFNQWLQSAPKNSLTVHALVPGMCKGQRDPTLKSRAYLVAEEVCELWKAKFPAARKISGSKDALGGHPRKGHAWLLQILLLSQNVAAASLVPCREVFGSRSGQVVWPNRYLPLGMANVDIEEKMPSSAYRKLLEAFCCMRTFPSSKDIVIDLGASPGGWTAAMLLLYKCRVVAVDRAELGPKLMKNPSVKFIQGDAFSYRPPRQVTWMVSDIISYPERVAELLQDWCGQKWAKYMVLTVKFRGLEPTWNSLYNAMQVASANGYQARAKHFFNNKNEVTLMLRDNETRDEGIETKVGELPQPIYKISWPK